MRNLIYVPVVHTPADMGTLAGSVERAYRDRYGQDRWLAHASKVREMWKGIRARIEAMDLDFRRVKVYQDGLPVCGKEEEIVRDLSRRGNANHRLVLRLVRAGARLVGTESPGLLLREYELVKAQVAAGATPNGAWAQQQRVILDERDRFIAARIDETLAPGETGMLFIGLLHDVRRYLPAGVEVRYLIHRLPFERDSKEGRRHDE